jgi:hypothetical protein
MKGGPGAERNEWRRLRGRLRQPRRNVCGWGAGCAGVHSSLNCEESARWGNDCHAAAIRAGTDPADMQCLLHWRKGASHLAGTPSHLLQMSEIAAAPRLCNAAGTHLPHLPQPTSRTSSSPRIRRELGSLNLDFPRQGSRHASTHLL